MNVNKPIREDGAHVGVDLRLIAHVISGPVLMLGGLVESVDVLGIKFVNIFNQLLLLLSKATGDLERAVRTVVSVDTAFFLEIFLCRAAAAGGIP